MLTSPNSSNKTHQPSDSKRPYSWRLKAQRLGQQHAHWLLRAAFASVFFFHGIGKLSTLQQFAQMMHLSLTTALAVALCETASAILITLGGLGLSANQHSWLTRLGSLLVIPVLLGAIILWHWGQWSFVATRSHPMGGMEFQIIMLLLAAYLAILGDARQPHQHSPRKTAPIR